MGNKMDRRQFIKGAAVVSTGIAVAGLGVKEADALPAPTKWDQEFDVVIVGGGGAGLCAAIEACRAGATVVVLEKEPVTGGSSVICGGALALAPNELQKKENIKDSVNLFFEDMMNIGKNKNDPVLVKTYVDKSEDCFYFLKDIGVKFNDVKIMPGVSVPRVLGTDPGQVMRTIRDEAAKQGATIMLNTAGRRLYTDSAGRIVGIKATKQKKDFNIKAKRAVILTTGGFGRNKDMLKEFGSLPLDLAIPVVALGHTGDGHLMAFEVGAGTKDISMALGPHTGPSCPIDVATNLLCMPNYAGAIMLNKNGKRFVNESISYNSISTYGLDQPDAIMIQIADEPIVKVAPFTAGSKPFKADTLEELAPMVGLQPQVLVEAVKTYNEYTKAGKDPEFGRETLVGIAGKILPIANPPFYGFVTKPGILSTKGGLKTDKDAHAINVFGEIIPSLYVAGEIVGGIHGAGYHTGSQFGKAMVFGRIAGINAVAEKPLS